MSFSEKSRFLNFNGMPDSAGNLNEIQSSLSASLGTKNRGRDNLDEDVAAASKRILLQNIEFHPASAPQNMQRDALKAKYILLNSSSAQAQQTRPWGDASVSPQQKLQQQQQKTAMTSPGHSDKNGETLPSPRVVLYPEEKVNMEWTRLPRIGAGLVNMGNTCFFNSTLQCLTYTAPLVNYCYTNDHREKCKKKDFCMMCEIQAHIKTSLNCGGRCIKPHTMLQKLRCIAKHMKWGRQEDAHEFLRFLVDHLQQSCLHGETKLDRFSKETTIINQIFGGYLRSQVTCLMCQAKSNTFDPFMDLSLDIKGVNTVEDALYKYVKPETLENENAYKCPKCKNKVRAQKRFSIQKAPNVLTLQLNRFDFNRHLSGKINRSIRYPEKISLRNYMSQKQGEPVVYHLYGVVVHSGYSPDHGHYFSYVKSPNKTWYCMNDSSVHQVNSNSVLNQNTDAYVLFYARSNKSSSSSGTHSGLNNVHAKNVTPVKAPYSSSMMPKQDKSPIVNGIHGKPTSELGTPIQRQSPAGSSFSPSLASNGPKIVPHGTSPSALPGAHGKISFPILTPQQKKQQQLLQQKEDGKRIVLQIKHGNSTTMEKSPDGKSKLVDNGKGANPVSQARLSGLVPYNDDSDSEQENNGYGASSSSRVSKSPNHRTEEAASTSSTSSGVQASGDHHYHHNYASVRSIPLPPLPSDSGDGHYGTSKKGPKNGISVPPSSTSSNSPASNGHTSHSQHKHFQNGIKQSPQSDSLYRKDLPASLSRHHPPSPKVTTIAHHGDAFSSSTSLQAMAAAGKGGVVALELPPVVNVSSSSYSTPTCHSAKVKATSGNFLVLPQDCAPSPRGSCSSTNSVNSTTEWTVESKGPSSNGHVLKSKFDGEGSYGSKPFTFPTHQSSERLKPDVQSSESLKCDARSDKSDGPKKALFKQDFSPHKKERRLSVEREGSRTPVHISDRAPLISPSGSVNSDSSSHKKLKKHKKKQKYMDRRDTNSRDRGRESREGSSSQSDHTSIETVIPPTPVDISDRRGLLSPSSSIASDSGLRKVKKHKKKQKHKDRDTFSREDEDSSSRSDSASQKKKHRHKHKKDKMEKHRKKVDKSKDSDSQNSDSSYEKRHKYKKHKDAKLDYDSSDSSEESSRGRHKRSSKASRSQEDYEWVEKKIESPRQVFTPKSKASVQTWNHHIKDDIAPKKNGSHSKAAAQWDGSRVPKITKDLNGSSQSLGNVMSWDGKKNHVDREIEEDRLSKKRHWSDEYNEELDSGKVKKTKKRQEDYGFGSHNPFQNHQSDKHRDGFSPWSQDHSYHQHHDHHYHKKSPSSHQHWRHNNHQSPHINGRGGRFNKPYHSQNKSW